MIRRTAGSDWLLIAQADHARLAGELAARVGNQLFDHPEKRELFTRAVALHDDGWIDIDRQPTCNAAQEPIDFMEIPFEIGLQAWGTSAERAAEIDPLIGLLVSLHSLSLSIDRAASDKHAMSDATTRFAVNKFQHRQIELQEQCRKQLGLAADQPLRHGLAESSDDPREKTIVHQFRLLQAMDQLSLCACCTKPPTMQITPVSARPGGRAITLRVSRLNATTHRVSPWPMEDSPLTFAVPAVRLPATKIASAADFHAAFTNAPRESIQLTLSASR